MVTLTEEMVIARTKISNLESITKLNFCSRELRDVSILQKMKNVTVLSLSVNNIDSLEVFQHLTKLEDLFLRKNSIADLNQVCYLQKLPELQNLWLQDNPCAADDDEYRLAVIRALPRLKKLDNAVVESMEIERAQRMGKPLVHPGLLQSQEYYASDEEEPFYQNQPEDPVERFPVKEEYVGAEEEEEEEEGSRSPEEEYPPIGRYSPPQPPANFQMPQKARETNNYEGITNGNGYSHAENEEGYSENKLYHRPPHQQPPPANATQYHQSQNNTYYPKYEESGDEMERRREGRRERPQGSLPRSRTGSIHPEMYHQNVQQPLYTSQRFFFRTDGELGHYSCPNHCGISSGSNCSQHRRPLLDRKTNVLNAVLCLVKELDYPNLEVVQMAVKCRMDELCSDHPHLQ